MIIPLVSIIVPFYNAASTISDMINSLVSQTYNHIEIILIDDSSTDDAIKIVSKFKDKRIKLFKREHKGPAIQRNFGIKKSKGDYIAFLDADDIAYQNRIEKQLNFLQTNSDIDIVGSQADFIDWRGKTIGKYEVPINELNYFFPVYCPVITSSLLIRKKVFSRIGFFREIFEVGTDYEWLYKAFKNGVNIVNQTETLLKFRLHNASFTTRNNEYLNKKMYNLTKKQMINIYTKKIKDYDYYFRMGLIYYYYGNVSKSIKFFLRSISCKPSKLLINLRYIVPSVLGNKNIDKIRTSNISFKINKLLKTININIAYKK